MAFKTHLIALLRKKNYKQETINHLWVFIWYLVLLPKDLNQQLLFNLSKTTDMPLVTEGDIMFMNELVLFKYGKSIDQMLEEIKNAIVAKEEQLLAQQKAKEEQLLAQQKAKEEQLLAQQKAKEEQLLAQQKAKEEQLLAQQKAKEEQLLAQQKAKEEHTIINMYQKLAIDVATIANILSVSTDFVQEVLSKKGLV
jgi:hypothetical protein